MRPLARYADQTARAVAKRRGGGLAALQLDWATAAGEDIAAWTRPEKLTPGRGAQGGMLTLAVESARALELQHLQGALIARLNGYLGGQPIARLKIRQTGPMPRTPSPTRAGAMANPPAPSPEVDAAVADVEDPDLRAALLRLGAALTKP